MRARHADSIGLYVRKKDFSKAWEAYEEAPALASRLAPAANNLGFLYSERGGDKEKALQLAQIQGGCPGRPVRLGHSRTDPLQAHARKSNAARTWT